MKTAMRKEVNQGVADKLLLKDASLYQITRQLHKSHRLTMVECALVSVVIGYVIGLAV